EELGAEPKAFLAAQPEVLAQHSGDGDSAVENYERWDISFPLQNLGAVAATGISATLATSTPGVSILQDQATYPDAVASAIVQQDLPFRFLVGPSVPCGSTITLDLSVSYSGGTGQPLLHGTAVQTGEPGAP